MKKMLTNFILLSFSFLNFIFPNEAHVETVAHWSFEQGEEKLFLTATLDKRYLAAALRKNMDCAPQDMLRICADRYLQTQFNFSINQQKIIYRQVSQELQKNVLLIHYEIPWCDAVESFSVESEYVEKNNSHAISKFSFFLNGETKHFTLKNDRIKLTANFGAIAKKN